jgi:hypothetical protein
MRGGRDDEDGTVGVREYATGDAPKQGAAHPAEAARADDDDVGVDSVGDPEDSVGGLVGDELEVVLEASLAGEQCGFPESAVVPSPWEPLRHLVVRQGDGLDDVDEGDASVQTGGEVEAALDCRA